MSSTDDVVFYTLQIPLSEFIFKDEDEYNFVVNNHEINNGIAIIPLKTSPSKLRIFEHSESESGSFKSYLCKYIFDIDYDILIKDEALLVCFDNIVKNILLSSYLNSRLYRGFTYDVYIQYDSDLNTVIDEQMSAIEDFITLLELKDFLQHSVYIKNKNGKGKHVNINYIFETYPIQEFNNRLYPYIEKWHKCNITDDGNMLYHFSVNFLIQEGIQFAITAEYFKRLKAMMKTVRSKDKKTTEIRRMYKSLLSSVDRIFIEVYKTIHGDKEGVKIYRHISLLHLINLFDLIPKGEIIKDVLYGTDETIDSIHHRVGKYMKIRI